jgi:hypothetical protein
LPLRRGLHNRALRPKIAPNGAKTAIGRSSPRQTSAMIVAWKPAAPPQLRKTSG